MGGADPDRILAAVVGTDIRGDKMSGAPSGAVGLRNCWAAKPDMVAGDSIRDSAATAATRRHSSSQAGKDKIAL